MTVPSKVQSVDEFCEAYGLSKSMFYKLLRTGKAPRIMKVGRRTLISFEAAEEWQRSVEQKTV